MNWLDRKKKEADASFEKMQTMYHIPQKYKDASLALFKTPRHKIQNGHDLIEDYEEIYEKMQYQIPKAIGQELEIFFAPDDQYFVGIHRTNLPLASVYNNIFNNGLMGRSTDITSTVQSMPYFPMMLREIIRCNGWKNSTGCILIKIPRNIKFPIHFMGNHPYNSSEVPFLLPEYIYGYVSVHNQQITSFAKNPLYRDTHNYQPNGLYYDEYLQTELHKEQIQKGQRIA